MLPLMLIEADEAEMDDLSLSFSLQAASRYHWLCKHRLRVRYIVLG